MTKQYFIKSLKGLKTEFILIVISLLAVAWLQVPRLGDEFRVDEDFRSFYWMNKFQDGELFPDYSRGYTEIHLPWGAIPVTFKSMGYGLLFYLASFFVTPIFFSKLLPFFLMPLTVLYLFKFGKLTMGRNTGIVLALGFLFFNLASSSAISIANGLQRSFALTLIIILVYYLHCQKYIATLIALVLSALIYAPVFALGAVIWGIYAIRENWPLRRLSLARGGLGYLLIVFCLGALILLPLLLPRIINIFSPNTSANVQSQQTISYQYLWNNPAYQAGGAAPLFIIFPVVGRGGLVDLGEDIINLLIFLVIGLIVIFVRGRKAFDLPNVVWYLLGATVILYILAWLVIWLTDSPSLLYWPSRYTRVGLFLFGLFFISFNSMDFLKEAPVVLLYRPKRLAWLLAAIEIVIVGLIIGYPSEWTKVGTFNVKWLLILAGIVFGMLGVIIIRRSPRPSRKVPEFRQSCEGRILSGVAALIFLIGWAVYTPLFTEVSYLNPTETERALYKFLQALPKDALIAGTPCALDSVPLFARRQALFSCEFGKTEAIIPEALQAYYADNRQEVSEFCWKHNVDYFVVDREAYEPRFLSQGQIYFEPYNQEVLSQISGQDKFILAELPDRKKIFQAENFFVVPCNRFGEMN